VLTASHHQIAAQTLKHYGLQRPVKELLALDVRATSLSVFPNLDLRLARLYIDALLAKNLLITSSRINSKHSANTTR
jgi:hypothetical protein